MPLTIYKSSAGSGKTYTLVQEYVKLLVREPREFRNILAITFTNKATDEMKVRIISALSKMINGEFNDLEDYIIADLKLLESGHEKLDTLEKARIEVRKRASTALNNILHNYSEFSVSTIDSFFQQILRSFTKELKLPQRYEVEMRTGYVMDQITAKLLTEIGHIIALTDWLTDYAYSQLEDDKGWNIERSIKDLGAQIFREDVWKKLNEDAAAESLTELLTEAEKEAARETRYKEMNELITELWATKRSFENQLKKFAADAFELAAGYGLETKDFKRGSFTYFSNLAKGKFEFKATHQKIYLGKESEWTTKTAAKKEKIEQLVQNGLQDLFVESVKYYEKKIVAYNSAAEVLKNIYVYGILNDLKEKLTDYRTQENLMLISDTGNLMRAIVHDSSLEFIFEKVGIVYKHILLDEFQDTSDSQWRALVHLVINSLAEMNSSLVVGDVKQSIYRWRGGDMKLLLSNMSDSIPDAYYDADSVKDLATNYRSLEHIVRFNNAFFITATQVLKSELTPQLTSANADKIVAAYAAVIQEVKHEQGGLVTVNFLPSSRDASWKESAREKLLELIAEIQEEGYSLKDIAILVRRNSEGNEVAELLAENGIKVISSESLLLKNSPKVQLLINILQYLTDHRDVIAKTGILFNYLKISQPDYKIDHEVFSDHLIAKDEPNLFNKLLPKAFTSQLNYLIKKPLYELIEACIQAFSLQKNADAYIQRFQDVVLDFNTQKSPDIRDFLAWWNENKDSQDTSIIVPEGEEAVTIMSIHKSKGLEFPIVVMPFCDWGLKPKNGSILWTSSPKAPYNKMGAIPLRMSEKLSQSHFAHDYEQEFLDSYIDNLNLLYVAFTRPTDRLYILTKKPGKTATGISSVHHLLYATFGNALFPYQEHFDFAAEQFQLPEAANPKVQKEGEEVQELTTLQSYISNNYHERITLRTDSERFFLLFDGEQSKAIKMGQQIHTVLEKLERTEDIDKVIRQLQIQGIIAAKDKATIKQRIQKIFEVPVVQNWFSPHYEVLAERSILQNQSRSIPDRVLLQNNQATIIDYKTVQNIDNIDAKLKAKYQKQVDGYAETLTRMGYEVVEKYLLFIGGRVLVFKW